MSDRTLLLWGVIYHSREVSCVLFTIRESRDAASPADSRVQTTERNALLKTAINFYQTLIEILNLKTTRWHIYDMTIYNFFLSKQLIRARFNLIKISDNNNM